MNTIRRCVPVVLLTVTIGLLHVSAAAQVADSTTLRHVVVLGASASAGHRTGKEIEKYGDDVPLAELLRAMIRHESAQVTDRADELFFIAPDSSAVEMVGKASAEKPSCVVAIDFLFWFGYGNVKTLEIRQRRLARGLELLEKFSCPLLISELPDMRRAAVHGKMNPKQVPDRAMLEALNRKIAAWAKPRKNVFIVPLRQKLADLAAGKIVKVGRATWEPPSAERELLQPDRLHPTIAGLSMTASLVLQTLVARKLVAASEVRLDPGAAATRVIDSRRRSEADGKKR